MYYNNQIISIKIKNYTNENKPSRWVSMMVDLYSGKNVAVKVVGGDRAMFTTLDYGYCFRIEDIDEDSSDSNFMEALRI